MKTKRKWIIAAGIVIVAGLLVNFGLNQGYPGRAFYCESGAGADQ